MFHFEFGFRRKNKTVFKSQLWLYFQTNKFYFERSGKKKRPQWNLNLRHEGNLFVFAPISHSPFPLPPFFVTRAPKTSPPGTFESSETVTYLSEGGHLESSACNNSRRYRTQLRLIQKVYALHNYIHKHLYLSVYSLNTSVNGYYLFSFIFS